MQTTLLDIIDTKKKTLNLTEWSFVSPLSVSIKFLGISAVVKRPMSVFQCLYFAKMRHSNFDSQSTWINFALDGTAHGSVKSTTLDNTSDLAANF